MIEIEDHSYAIIGRSGISTAVTVFLCHFREFGTNPVIAVKDLTDFYKRHGCL